MEIKKKSITPFFYHGATALVGQGLHIIEYSWSNSETSHLVGLLWKSDQQDPENSTWQHTTLTRDRHPYPRRDSNPQSQQASGRRPTPQTARPLGSAITPIASLNFAPDSPTLYSPNEGIGQLQDFHDQNTIPREVSKVMPFEWSSNVFSEGTKTLHGHKDGWIYYL